MRNRAGFSTKHWPTALQRFANFFSCKTDGEFFWFHSFTQDCERSRKHLYKSESILRLAALILQVHLSNDDPKRLHYWLPHVKAVIAHAKELGVQAPELFGPFGAMLMRGGLLKEFAAKRLNYVDFIPDPRLQ